MLSADSRTGGADLTGGPLEFRVRAPAGPALAGPSAVTDLLV